MIRKGSVFLLFWYAVLIISVVLATLLPLLGHPFLSWSFWLSQEQFVLNVIVLVLLLTFFLTTLVRTVSLLSTQILRQKIKAIVQNKTLPLSSDDDQLINQLADKVRNLTRQVQLIDNQDLVKREEIIETERKRIARDLHDTVSQELFASSMVLSGLSMNAGNLSADTLQDQLQVVKGMIETAQKDLRILLLHLRPSELDGKSLVEGFEVILKEVSDKSSVQVAFQHDVTNLPTGIEEHLFRIGQEIISNTLKHARAKRLEVYLLQTTDELQLKMVDDGVGFDQTQEQELSYGLYNIRERVEDMAGSLKIRTAKDKGVSIDIRIPLLKGKEDE